MGGWALPLICLALLTGSSLLAAALQQSLIEQERIAELRHERLQAQALAEGLLSRVWALIDDPRAVDAACRTMPSVAGPDGAASPPGVAASGSRFSERLLQTGRSLGCHLMLQGHWDVEAWHCDCRLGDPAVGGMPDAAADSTAAVGNLGAPSRGYAELKVESTDEGWRLVVQACALRPSAGGYPATCGSGGGGGGPAALIWRASVRLKPDPQGRWREVAGSWTDLP